MLSVCRCFIFALVIIIIISSIQQNVLSCDQIDRDALLSFHRHVITPNAPPLLNWSSSPTDCCRWEGITCHVDNLRVTRLSLPGKSLSGTIDFPSLTNLTFLSHLNLSRNRFSGFQSDPPVSLRFLDLSSNRLNGSLNPSFFHRAVNLISLNISNNSFAGPIPNFCSSGSPSLEILDFSVNKFTGNITPGFGGCSNLRVLRGGFNSLSGFLPRDIFTVTTLNEISLPNNFLTGPIDAAIARLSGLTVLELHVNELTGGIPANIGLLSNLQQLQLHTNSLNGTLPSSLTDCANLKTLLLRNNLFTGDISNLDFGNLQKLQAIDLGNNSFVGEIPTSLCLCRSLTAVRFAYNRLTGEIPPCMASLRSLHHLSISDNYLSNVVGALKILRHCENLEVLFLSRCFDNETMPDDHDLLHLDDGFQNLQILTLGGCQLSGQIPSWISKLRKLKVLNLSYNKISGSIPKWVGSMPSLFVLNLTQNDLSGKIPREIGFLPALISDNTSSDLSSLALPFLFDARQYNRLFNLPRGLKVGYNRLSGNIPEEIGRLKLLHLLDLNDNSFNGSIPRQLSRLVNLERLDLSGNNLTGQIPGSLTRLSFLSSFSVANNDLEGEIPRGGQFDTFGEGSFEGNPKLCGYVIKKRCGVVVQEEMGGEEEEEDGIESAWYNVPFGLGYFVGIFAVMIVMLCNSS
ncbi:receptor-like protein 2 [Phtheirospermum japonicum]|uniref:Receptor-like protein 2 n=1 Tax=Phtheirospermum japonicum TaxID=374723 RepID=A0A830C8Q2_9LAMI|nr:receptor-like protein 2 [Phtheirospermum japonicum]